MSQIQIFQMPIRKTTSHGSRQVMQCLAYMIQINPREKNGVQLTGAGVARFEQPVPGVMALMSPVDVDDPD